MPINPTAKQRRLGRLLRDARVAARLTHQDAAAVLGCKQPKISKIETARMGVNSDDVRTLAEAYGLDATRVEALARLAREARKRGWWHNFKDSMPADGDDFIELETDAIHACNYEADVLPGLLQSEDYARALIRVFAPDLDERTVEKRTEVRMQRQRRLSDGSLSLWAVVDSCALTRRVGSEETYRQQMKRLASDIQRPNVTFQVLPPDAGEHMALGTPFNLFFFAGSGGAVAIDHLAGTFCLEDQHIVDRYNLAFEHLRATALNTRDSLTWVRRVAES